MAPKRLDLSWRLSTARASDPYEGVNSPEQWKTVTKSAVHAVKVWQATQLRSWGKAKAKAKKKDEGVRIYVKNAVRSNETKKKGKGNSKTTHTSSGKRKQAEIEDDSGDDLAVKPSTINWELLLEKKWSCDKGPSHKFCYPNAESGCMRLQKKHIGLWALLLVSS